MFVFITRFYYLCIMDQNKDLIESYKLTTVRDRIGIYGQRLILRLVEFATAEGATQGLDFKSGKDIRRVEVGLWGERSVTMPLTDLMGGSENYSAVKRSVRALQKELIEYEEEDGAWVCFPFLGKVRIAAGQLTVKVEPELWRAFMDFRKGFRRFELESALQLKSTYSLRLYKLVSEQGAKQLDWQLDELKKMLGVANKYPRPYDFGKYVLDTAKEELDSVAPWSFSYSWLTSRKVASGRAAIVGVRFFPHYQPQHRDPDLATKQIRLKYSEVTAPDINQAQRNMLLHKFGFTQKGINNNQALFNAAVKYLDFTAFLLELAPRVSTVRPKNTPGYVTNAIKMELAAQGIDI